MAPTHATKAGIRYRYYVSLPCLHGEAKTAKVGSVTRVPATDIEEVVVKSLNVHLSSERGMPASAITNHSAIAEVIDRTEFAGGQDPRSTTRREAGTRPSAPRTGRSRQSRPHDCARMSSNPVTEVPSSAQYTWRRWSGLSRSQAWAVRRGYEARPIADWRCWSRGSIAGSRSTLRDAPAGTSTSSANTLENPHDASARPSQVGRLPARRKRSGTTDRSNRAPTCPSTRASVASALGAAARWSAVAEPAPLLPDRLATGTDQQSIQEAAWGDPTSTAGSPDSRPTANRIQFTTRTAEHRPQPLI